MVFWFPPDLQETAKLVNWLAKIGSRCCDLEAVLESLNCGIKLKDKKHKHSSGPRRHTRDGYVNVVAYDSVILRVIVEEAEANAKKDLNAFRRAKEALRREYAVDETRGSKDFLCFAEEVWGARGEVRRDLSWDYERL
ncbi:hypothetical protein DOTSEDRAFT_71835 [Dothistroma septosporum NZE10]|uniref:Uncharacterized protein n=1 Tax=Dothistroma septosporum (strain NZE10 / CBS 128990) TaxID=675120 RepID=N1PMJ3_DOTSN|nr:hypothetical protein DOTSEDRAFT_71835 [Dothistroma septosporum NZE10]